MRRSPTLLLSGWSVALALLAAPAPAHSVDQAIARAERALYAGDFAAASAAVSTALAGTSDDHARAELLLQRVRIQQTARLSGLPDAAESATLAALARLAASPAAGSGLKARIAFVGAVSEYFQRLDAPALGDLEPLAARFQAAAARLAQPCQRADALFFAALMPQMQDKVARSAPGLRRARQLAEAHGCPLELSYDLRHLAVVAEADGDLPGARRLAAESLALRQRIGFQVYLPYSMLLLAEYDEKLGDKPSAERRRREALALSERLGLPAQAQAARQALGSGGTE